MNSRTVFFLLLLAGSVPLSAMPELANPPVVRQCASLKELFDNPGSKQNFTRQLKRILDGLPDDDARLDLLFSLGKDINPIRTSAKLNLLDFAFYELSQTVPENRLYHLMHLYLTASRRSTAALRYLDALQPKDLSSSGLLRLAGTLLAGQNLYKKAGTFFEEAWRREQSIDNFQELVLYNLQISRFDKAAALVDGAREKFTGDASRVLLANLFLYLDRPEDTIREIGRMQVKSRNAALLEALAFLMLNRADEAFVLLDQSGNLNIQEFIQEPFPNEQLRHQQLRQYAEKGMRTRPLRESFRQSGLYSPLNGYYRQQMNRLSKNLLSDPAMQFRIRGNFLLAEIAGYYQTVSPEKQRRFVEVLRKNGWQVPELFLDAGRRAEHLAALRTKMQTGALDYGELFFLSVDTSFNKMSTEELEQLLAQLGRQKICSPSILRFYCGKKKIPLEKRMQMLKTHLAFADGAGLLPFFSIQQPEFKQLAFERLNRLLEDPKGTPIVWKEYLEQRCFNYLTEQKKYGALLDKFMQLTKNDAERLSLYPETSLTGIYGTNFISPNDVSAFLSGYARERETPLALSGIGTLQPLYQPFSASMRDRQNPINKAAFWQEVRKRDLPPLLEIWFAFQCGQDERAKILLDQLSASGGQKDSAFFLNMAAFYSQLKDWKQVEAMAAVLFRSQTVPVLHRQLAAQFLLKAKKHNQTLKDDISAAEYLLKTLPELRQNLFSFLLPSLRREQLAELKKNYPEPDPITSMEYMQVFARDFNRNRKQAAARLTELLENVLPVLRKTGYLPYQIISRGENDENTRQALKLAVRDIEAADANPLLIAVIYDFLLKDPQSALPYYREAQKRDPRDFIAAAKLCSLQKELDPQLLKTLSGAPANVWQILFAGDNANRNLEIIEHLLEYQENFTPSLYYSLTGALMKKYPHLPNLNQPGAFRTVDLSKPQEKRRIGLLLKLLGTSLNIPDLAVNARTVLFQISTANPVLIPQSMRDTLIAQYSPELDAYEQFRYTMFFLAEYLKSPEKMRPVLQKLDFGDAMKRWERLRTLTPEQFNKEISLDADSDASDLDAAVRLSEFLRIGGARGIQLDLASLFRQINSRKTYIYFYTNELQSYFNSFSSDKSLLQQLTRLGHVMRAQEPDCMDANGNYCGSFNFLYYAIQAMLSAQLENSMEFRKCFLHEYAMGDTDFIFSPFVRLELDDPFTAFSGTPLFGTMQTFRLDENRNPLNKLSEKTKQAFLKKLKEIPAGTRTFGMDVVIYLLPNSRNVADMTNVVIRRQEEWNALTEKRKLELLKTVRVLAAGLLNADSFAKAPEMNMKPLFAKLDELDTQEFLKLKKIPNGREWVIMNDVLRRVRNFANTNPELAEQLLRHLKTLAEEQEWTQRNLQDQVNRMFAESLGLARMLRKCGFESRPGSKNINLHRLAVNELRKQHPPKIFGVLTEIRTILPQEPLDSRQMFLILWDMRKHCDNALLAEFRGAREKDPKSAGWEMAVRFLEARNLQREKKPLPPDLKQYLSNQIRPLAARLNSAELMKEFPDLFDDPEFLTGIYAGQVNALNRRTQNNPEKAPRDYLNLIKQGLQFKNKLSKAEFKRLLSPLAVNSLETFPVLTEKDAREILPYLLEYVLYTDDRANLEILKEYTDLITPDYRRQVLDGKTFTPDAVSAFKTVFPEGDTKK